MTPTTLNPTTSLVEPSAKSGLFMKNPNQPAVSGSPHSAPQSLAEIERLAILAALEACGGSPALAAQQLQISTATIYRKIKSYRRAEQAKSA